jgi:hypothetical protein
MMFPVWHDDRRGGADRVPRERPVGLRSGALDRRLGGDRRHAPADERQRERHDHDETANAQHANSSRRPRGRVARRTRIALAGNWGRRSMLTSDRIDVQRMWREPGHRIGEVAAPLRTSRGIGADLAAFASVIARGLLDRQSGECEPQRHFGGFAQRLSDLTDVDRSGLTQSADMSRRSDGFSRALETVA